MIIDDESPKILLKERVLLRYYHNGRKERTLFITSSEYDRLLSSNNIIKAQYIKRSILNKYGSISIKNVYFQLKENIASLIVEK